MKKTVMLSGIVWGLSLAWGVAADGEGFAAKCRELAEGVEGSSVRGADGDWLFLVNELKHLGEGAFWEATADRVEVVGAYAKELEALGVKLVVVPVPAKAAIYPEKLVGEGSEVLATAPFYEQMREAGVEVVDLEEVYREAKDGGAGKLFCEQDAHWSPSGAEMAAGAVWDLVKEKGWLDGAAGEAWEIGGEETISIKGDQADGEFAGMAKETLALRKTKVVAADEASPVLLIGDSHLRVFTDGAEFHTTGAGFRDHLQARMGLAAAAYFTNGDGVYTPRVRIAKAAKKDPSFWDGKKLVVWCFSVRGFTSPLVRWVKLPAQP